MKQLQQRAQVLIEALPYIQKWAGQTIVIKYGGSVMTDPALQAMVAQDLALLRYVGVCPVVVHGGGPQVSEMMRRLGKEPEFIEGCRVTDAETMSIAQMVLVGTINQELVSAINTAGARAIGLSGKDANLIVACKKESSVGDLGQVGEVVSVDRAAIDLLTSHGYVVVISSIGVGAGGESYNINADTVAGDIAVALEAVKLVVLSDVPGVLHDPADPETLISELTLEQAQTALTDGTVSGGMIPKLQSVIRVVESGVPFAHLISGGTPHALLMELFTDQGVGTMIRR
ncbi:MAG: acetylglutamate kinase [candidate division WS1 bacterium]|jgi:acetylglutamate kinase|nr:acetylglutamate kinase [candidate division WS1 bacterium]